jgi:type IV pilus assembly protein PilM
MTSPQPGVWGIDLGQCALKALRLQNIDGVITATAFDYVEHPKILSQPDADPDQLTREALEKFLSRNQLRGDVVAVSIPGQSGLARFVKLPPVEEKKISDIVRFEAKQQIPFNLDEVVWDYQKIGSGVVTDGFAMETEIGLFAIKRDSVSRALQPFQEVGIEVSIIQMAPLALCNFVSYDLLNKEGLPVEGEEEAAKKQCVVALDIGVETSNLVITDGERIVWQRPIPIGGNRFTRALTKELKLTFAKAEHLKRNATKSPNLRQILQALKNDLGEFVNEVQKSLNFFASTHRDAHIQYMMGLGSAFRLPGLQKYLQERLQLEVRKLSKFQRLEGESVITAPVFADNLLSFAATYGLALQALKLSRLQTNLLPQEIRMERLIRSKKPWAVAAAAALLVGAAGLTLGYKLERDSVAAPVIREAEVTAAKPANEAVGRMIDKVKASKEAYRQLEDSVKAVIAGQEERLNWISLNKFINDCLPRPDGENLDPQQKAVYWAKGGDEAYKKYADRQASGDTDIEETLDDLILVNLESVGAMYTNDLATYFTRLQNSSKLYGMPESDQKTPPKLGDAGWVVELRGYTYNQAQDRFIRETLVQNLATKVPRKAAAPVEKAAAIVPGVPAPPPRKGPVNPLADRVGWPVLYRYRDDDKPAGPVFHLIDSTVLPGLVAGFMGGGPGGPGGPGVPGGPGPGGKMAAPRGRDAWRPLGSEGAKFAQGADKIIQQQPEEAKKADPLKKGQHRRTEFIVLFIWREPIGVEGSSDLPVFTPRTGTPTPPPRKGP